MAEIPYTASSGHGLVFWPWAAAVHAIPAGWARDDDYAGKFFQGSTAGGSTGGGTTHAHTQAHTHTGQTHSHGSCSLGTGTPTNQTVVQFNFSGIRIGAYVDHTHPGVTSTAVAETWPNDTTAPTASGGDPPYAEVIAIKPSAAGKLVPQYGVVLGRTVIADFVLCNGSGGTVNLRDKFLKGAAAASDPGSPGGSATHNHGTLAHTHTPTAQHTHPAFKCGLQGTSARALASAENYPATRDHHDIVLNMAGVATQSSSPAVGEADSEPAHVRLLPIQQDQSGERLSPGVIIGWTGSAATLASDFPDWKACDGTGGTLDLSATQIRCSTSNIGETGGADNHSHTIAAHTHNGNSHSHNSEVEGNIDYTTGCAAGAGAAGHRIKHTPGHAVSASSAGSAALSSTATTSSVDKRRPWRSVIWIVYDPPATVLVPGALIPGGLIP